MSKPRHPWTPTKPVFSRRQALKSCRRGFWIRRLRGNAWAKRVPKCGRRDDRAFVRDRTFGSQAAGLSREGQANHLPLHGRRCSHVDTWEYKPKLQAENGKVGPGGGILTGSKFQFAQHGRTGTWVSELFPHLAKKVDQLCFLRGLHTDTPAHPQAVVQLHTGAMNATLTRPSTGAWLCMDSARKIRIFRDTSRSILLPISAER